MESKYMLNQYGSSTNNITDLLMDEEEILWKGKPKKKAFILNKVLNLFPVAFIWLIFDGFFIAMLILTGGIKTMFWFVIPFFAIHLIPVWIWLANALGASKRWKNTEYAVTDKRIILRNGLFGYHYQSINYVDIEKVNMQVGLIDRILKVGDIKIVLSGKSDSNRDAAIIDIEQPFDVYKKIQKIVIDIQTDIHYPNVLRPGENHGYQTKYKG
ncbi:MAG TPA: PH domain-containing protein [Clostridiales bacterium]|nr:PH domain-containing protein [Clostridiales bacterium]